MFLRIFAFILALAGLLEKSMHAIFGKPAANASNNLCGSNTYLALQRETNSKVDITVIGSIFNPEHELLHYFENLHKLDCRETSEFIFILFQPSIGLLASSLRHAKAFENVSLYVANSYATIYETWNFAIEHSTAPLITNANIDDLKMKDTLARQKSFLDRNSNVDVCYTDYIERRTYVPTTDELPDDRQIKTFSQTLSGMLFKGENYAHASPMWRRELHLTNGFFDPSYLSSGDTEFWLRCLISGSRMVHTVGGPGYVFLNNQRGLSTAPNSKGKIEWAAAMERHAWKSVKRLLRTPWVD